MELLLGWEEGLPQKQSRKSCPGGGWVGGGATVGVGGGGDWPRVWECE